MTAAGILTVCICRLVRAVRQKYSTGSMTWWCRVTSVGQFLISMPVYGLNAMPFTYSLNAFTNLKSRFSLPSIGIVTRRTGRWRCQTLQTLFEISKALFIHLTEWQQLRLPLFYLLPLCGLRGVASIAASDGGAGWKKVEWRKPTRISSILVCKATNKEHLAVAITRLIH